MNITDIKKTIVAQVREQMRKLLYGGYEHLEALMRSIKDAPLAMQAKADLHKEEYEAIAENQSKNVRALEEGLEELEELKLPKQTKKVTVGSLVKVEEKGAPGYFFVLPFGGGEEIEIGPLDHPVRVVTPESPAGAALLERGVGDIVQFASKQVKIEKVI